MMQERIRAGVVKAILLYNVALQLSYGLGTIYAVVMIMCHFKIVFFDFENVATLISFLLFLFRLRVRKVCSISMRLPRLVTV